MAILSKWLSTPAAKYKAGLTGSIALLVLAMALVYPEFADPANAEVLVMNFILEGFMALGMTAVIVTGGIDLSVSAVVPFTAIITGLLLRAGSSIPVAIAAGLAAAAAVGAVNAGMRTAFRIHPFIATLATMLSLKGLNLVITRGAPLAGFPDAFAFFGRGRVLGVPFAIVLFAVLAVLASVFLGRHRWGQQLYLIGGNVRAARLSGVNVERVLLLVYVLSSTLAGVAGVIAASRYISASTGFGQNSELRVITAVAIGGASLNGGTGSIGGSILGVLFLALVYHAFAMTGVSTYWQDVVSGVMVLGAVLLAQLAGKRRSSTTPAAVEPAP
ncbi:MAG: ABC transporter permease [Bacteroidales bacterium]